MPDITEKISISREEYEKLRSIIKQQEAEIEALEYRIKTLMSKQP